MPPLRTRAPGCRVTGAIKGVGERPFAGTVTVAPRHAGTYGATYYTAEPQAIAVTGGVFALVLPPSSAVGPYTFTIGGTVHKNIIVPDAPAADLTQLLAGGRRG